MKLEYQEPTMDIVMLSSADVIATSGGVGGEGGDGWVDLPGEGFE